MDARPMDFFTFVNKKLDIGDVEPMYGAIVEAVPSLAARQMLCMGEGLADHLGLAATMADGPAKSFWARAEAFVRQGQRGGARRHFRATKALRAIEEMDRRFPRLQDFFDGMPDTWAEARKYITDCPEFGSFSAFKIADMAERTCDVRIDFSAATIADLSKFPRRGLALAAEFLGAEDAALLKKALRHRWRRLAPPHYDRPLNLQEVETCLCNYGHSKWHPPGYETAELKKLLEGHGRLAAKLQQHLPTRMFQ